MKRNDLKEVLVGIVIIFIVLLIFFLGAKYTGFLIYSTQPPQTFQKTSINYSTYAVDINSCQDLTTPNTVYRLTQTIIATTYPCFDVKADNITINCNGYAVLGNGSVRALNKTNLTIINCTFVINRRHAIFLENCTDVTIFNVNVTSRGGTGLYARDIRSGIVNNSIFSQSEYGIHFYNVSNFSVINSSFKSNAIGIFMEFETTNVSILENRFENNSKGLYLSQSNKNNISNNIFINNSRSISLYSIFGPPYCNNTIENNSIENGYKILYYHDQKSIEVKNNASIGELILCGINSSVIKNVTFQREGVIVRHCSNISIINSYFNTSKYIALDSCHLFNSLYENLTLINASFSALYFPSSICDVSNTTFNNITILNSGSLAGGYALFLESAFDSYNRFDNIKVYRTSNFLDLNPQTVFAPQNFTNLTLGYNETFGKVFWPFLNLTFANINSTTSAFDPEFISIDTTVNTQFNKNATLFLYSADTPTIYYASGFYSTKNNIINSGSQCPSTRCTAMSYNSTTKLAIVNLTQFSSYAASYCGDGICAPNEDHSSCPADCPAPPSGGGPSVVRLKPIKAPLACIPSRTIISSTPCVLNISLGAIYGGKKTITYKIINSTCGITYQTVTVSCNPFVALPYTVTLPVSVIFIGHFITPSFTTPTSSYAPATGGSAIFVIKHNGSFILPNITINVTPNVTEEASPITGKMTSLGITSTKLKGMAYEKCKALFKLQNVSFEKRDLAPNEELKAKIEFTTPWTIFSQIPLIFRLYSNNVPIKDFVYPINVDIPDFMFDIIPSEDSFAVCLLFDPKKLSCSAAAYEFELNLNKNHWTSIADHYGPIRTTKPVLIAYEFSTDPAMLKKIKTASLKLYCKGKIIKKKTIPFWR